MGGHTAHMMVRNILKKAITNPLAENFSWVGRKAKRSFRDLHLAQVIKGTFISYIYIT